MPWEVGRGQRGRGVCWSDSLPHPASERVDRARGAEGCHLALDTYPRDYRARLVLSDILEEQGAWLPALAQRWMAARGAAPLHAPFAGRPVRWEWWLGADAWQDRCHYLGPSLFVALPGWKEGRGGVYTRSMSNTRREAEGKLAVAFGWLAANDPDYFARLEEEASHATVGDLVGPLGWGVVGTDRPPVRGGVARWEGP